MTITIKDIAKMVYLADGVLSALRFRVIDENGTEDLVERLLNSARDLTEAIGITPEEILEKLSPIKSRILGLYRSGEVNTEAYILDNLCADPSVPDEYLLELFAMRVRDKMISFVLQSNAADGARKKAAEKEPTGVAELQQTPSLYYLLVKTLEPSNGSGEVLGVYRNAGILKTAYDKAVRELEKEQKDSGTSEKITINSFDETINVWQYDIDPKQLFKSKHTEGGNVIVECVMDSPYMIKWRQENVAKDIYGYICSNTPVRSSDNDESILVRFDIEHTYEVLDKLAFYWGSFNSCPSWQTMRDVSKKWHEKYNAELILIAHDALKFQCRRLTEEEAAEIIAEANSLTAEVINCNNELNKNLAGHNSFTLWWD